MAADSHVGRELRLSQVGRELRLSQVGREMPTALTITLTLTLTPRRGEAGRGSRLTLTNGPISYVLLKGRLP